jgi:hypothetical protein
MIGQEATPRAAVCKQCALYSSLRVLSLSIQHMGTVPASLHENGQRVIAQSGLTSAQHRPQGHHHCPLSLPFESCTPETPEDGTEGHLNMTSVQFSPFPLRETEAVREDGTCWVLLPTRVGPLMTLKEK